MSGRSPIGPRRRVRCADAAIFSNALVDADLHGVGTHGISRLNIYLQRIQKGRSILRRHLGSSA